MNIKVAAFTVSEKSSNTRTLCSRLLEQPFLGIISVAQFVATMADVLLGGVINF